MNYTLIIAQAKTLTENSSNYVGNRANVSALLYFGMPNVSWAGFYLLEGNSLKLNCFCGKPACLEIPIGKGVCGRAAESKQTVMVADVHTFSGHIACDSDSNAEIVVPIIKKGSLYGVLDIDSYKKDRFTENEKQFLEKLIAEIIEYI